MNNSENSNSISENISDLTEEQRASAAVGQASSETESGVMSFSASVVSSTPTYSDPKSYPEAPFSYRFSERENVSLGTGGLEYRESDFTLPGKNGFDLAIARVYSSSESGLYEMASESYGSGQLRTIRRENTHNLLQ